MRAAAQDISERVHKQNGRRTQTLSGRCVRKGAVLLGVFQGFGPGSCLIRQLQKPLIVKDIWPRGKSSGRQTCTTKTISKWQIEQKVAVTCS